MNGAIASSSSSRQACQNLRGVPTVAYRAEARFMLKSNWAK